MSEPEAAVAILHAPAPADSILLMRRAERPDDSWSGHWSFPSSRRHREDRDPLATALRELKEECGIRLPRERLRTTLEAVPARRKEGHYLLVAPFVLDVEAELPTTLDAREAVASCWVKLSLLRDPMRHALGPVPGRPREMLFPAVDLEGLPLWGFTYRLITNWLGLIPSAPVEQAGFEAARDVLDFLLRRGLTLAQDWDSAGQPGASVATVTGPIPVPEVLDAFSTPGRYCTAVNCLEVGQDSIRLIGPAFEEYTIRQKV